MKILRKREVYRGKYFKVIERKFLNKQGRKGIWESIERNIYKAKIVVIFALTPEKEVILERNFRIPLNSWIIELPAGLVDKKKETAKATAKRELLEETGHLVKKLIPVFSGPFNAGLEKSELIFFFGKNAKFVGKKAGDDAEEIEVMKVPLKNLVDFTLHPPKKTKVDAKILSLLPILEKKKLI